METTTALQTVELFRYLHVYVDVTSCARPALRSCPRYIDLALEMPKPQVRLVSTVHGLDVTLPLLSSRPPDDLKDDVEQPSETPCEEKKNAVGQPPPSDTNKKKSVVREDVKIAATADEKARDGDGTAAPVKKRGWEEREVPASADSFFFAVPSLPMPTSKQASKGGNLLFLGRCVCRG